ncbi:MAG: DNA-processing protein DprA [Thermoplasmata archaeon]
MKQLRLYEDVPLDKIAGNPIYIPTTASVDEPIGKNSDIKKTTFVKNMGQKILDNNDGNNYKKEDAKVEQLVNKLYPIPYRTISIEDPEYPERLHKIPDPPHVLFITGSISNFEKCIAISGTRSPSEWGISASRKVGRMLVSEGYIVVSGLARGIDTAAHLGALDSPQGKTIAVITELSRIYPPENEKLVQRISTNGAVISEKLAHQKIEKYHFIRRNRIISGLSIVHFIIESAGTGGTLQQVKIALRQKRPVYVLKPPDENREAKKGYHLYINMGAKPCESIEEVLSIVKSEMEG